MNMHRNAKLGLAGRFALLQTIETGSSIREAARRHGVSPGRRRFVSPVDWSAWCGSRRHLGVVVRFDGLAARSRFNYLPRCDQPGSASKLLPTSS